MKREQLCIEEKRAVFTVSSKKGLDITANTLRSQIHRIKRPLVPHSR